MSEALFYANALEVSDKNPALINVNNRAAAELRRLHAENEALKEALKEAEQLDADANVLAASSSALADSVDKLIAPTPRKPLTDEEIINIGKEASAIEGPHILPVSFARAIEAAHGIVEQKEKEWK